MSAGMVGLNMPAPFAEGETPTMEQGRPGRPAKGTEGEGSLQTMFSGSSGNPTS